MNISHPFPIEGDFLLTTDGFIFEGKGFVHPEDRAIAFLRYIPAQNVESTKNPIEHIGRNKPTHRRLWQTQSYSLASAPYYHKIYEIPKRFAYLQEHAPQYLYSSTKVYFPLQAIPLDKIKAHLKPEEAWTRLNTATHEETKANQILEKAMNFLDILREGTGIARSRIGLTGSVGLGIINDQSDLDFIIYGYGNSLKVREFLRSQFDTKASSTNKKNPSLPTTLSQIPNPPVPNFKRYNLTEFKSLYKARVPNQIISFYQFLNYEIRKLHQGKFQNTDFFIRFLEWETREEYQQHNTFPSQTIQSLGKLTISGEIRGDEFWWTTPARVQPINIHIDQKDKLHPNYKTILEDAHLQLTDIVQTFTLRGRFTENVRLLEHFRAHGTLELVQRKDKSYLQLNFGADSSDYFIVI